MLRQDNVLRLAALGIAAITLASCDPASNRVELDSKDYAAAVALDNPGLSALVRNASIVPHWIDGEDRFWYRRDTVDGAEIIIVDARTGARRAAFDMETMSAALVELAGEDAANAVASPVMMTAAEGELQVTFQAGGQSIVCDAQTVACEANPAAMAPAPDLLIETDGTRAAFVRDHDLWLRDLVSGEETQLTDDGEAFAAYGAPGDQMRLGQMLRGFPDGPPVSTHWSPDSRFLISRRLDERTLPAYPFIESVPRDGSFRPRVHEVRAALLGDPDQAHSTYFIIDTQSGEVRPVHLPGGFDLDEMRTGNRPLGWSDDGRYAYLYASTVDARTAVTASCMTPISHNGSALISRSTCTARSRRSRWLGSVAMCHIDVLNEDGVVQQLRA